MLEFHLVLLSYKESRYRLVQFESTFAELSIIVESIQIIELLIDSKSAIFSEDNPFLVEKVLTSYSIFPKLINNMIGKYLILIKFERLFFLNMVKQPTLNINFY